MKYTKSCLNYTGGKYKLLNQIVPLIPNDIRRFYDIFCGGCNVGINIEADEVVFNDKLKELIDLYKIFQQLDTKFIFHKVQELMSKYNLSDTYKNDYSKYNSDSSKGLAVYNKEGYLRLRNDYNSFKPITNEDIIEKNIMLYTLIVYGFNNQIRFNKKGEYNIPVGKRDFNKNVRANLELFIKALNKANIKFESSDYVKLNYDDLGSKDFVYVDPPYLITTATYNEQGGWTETNEKELLSFLDWLNEKGIRFALSNVLESKGQENLILADWCKKYNIHYLNKDYNNSNYQIKDKSKKSVEVLITNY